MSDQIAIVIGGGAAGFFCAINAAAHNPSLKIIIVEKTGKLLSKVRVSGGGRCNVTHASDDIIEMARCYPRGHQFIKKSFHHFFTKDTIAWFGQKGVQLKTEADGRMFPVTDSSQTIIDCLVNEVDKYGIEILLNREIKTIAYYNNTWILAGQNNNETIADYVCIAAGGHHKMSQFQWLSNLKHKIVEPVPSLFTFNVKEHLLKELMGVSVPSVLVKIKGTKLIQEGPFLITHWGFSGPAVLKLSAYAAIKLHTMQYDFIILINWLPEFNETALHNKLKTLRQDLSQQKIKNQHFFNIPQRLWEYFLKVAGIDADLKWGQVPAKEMNLLGKTLCSSEYKILGKTTFKEEFVTAGGIDLEEIDADTMQSKLWPHLYFAGEIMNIDGITGGYNFQHAWTSGWIAGRTIGEVSKANYNQGN
jgi:predicted Rossmann fold flavoprotein